MATTTKLLASMVYHYKGMGLSMSNMICVWDKRRPGECGLLGVGGCGVKDLGIEAYSTGGYG